MEPRPIFSLANSNKDWVVRELDKLRSEWAAWLKGALSLDDSPDFDPRTCAQCVKGGFENIRKHAVLREKTLVFICNQFVGYDFLFDDWLTIVTKIT